MTRPLEHAVEAQFVEWVEAVGFRTIKLELRHDRGWPDRIVILPGGVTVWVEFKRLGEVPTKLQQHRHNFLRAHGHVVICTDDARTAYDEVKRRAV
jgi:hypothetical protein